MATIIYLLEKHQAHWTPQDIWTCLMEHATLLKDRHDGRLAAIMDRVCQEVSSEFPGTWKQRLTSKTIAAQLAKYLWAKGEKRIMRLLRRA